MPSVFMGILWTKSYSMWHDQIERLEEVTAYFPQEYQELNILQLQFPFGQMFSSVSGLCLSLVQQVSSLRDPKAHICLGVFTSNLIWCSLPLWVISLADFETLPGCLLRVALEGSSAC